MIGNDIVDLREARLKSNWERPGFLEKVFSSSEQELIHSSKNPFQMVWRLWSMKESAYKFYVQKSPAPIRGFYPSKINCQINSEQEGEVIIQGLMVRTNTVLCPEYVFTSTFSKANVMAETVIFSLPPENSKIQSTFTRNKLIDFLVQKYQLKREHLKIKKDKNNIPEIFYRSGLLALSCSLTHHGKYGGCSVIG